MSVCNKESGPSPASTSSAIATAHSKGIISQSAETARSSDGARASQNFLFWQADRLNIDYGLPRRG